MFGANKPFGGTNTPGFGGFNTGTTPSPFGQSTFGNKPATSTFSSPSFGSTGSGLFGNPAQPTTGGLFGTTPSTFGQSATTSTFGGTSGFGSMTTSGSLFGQPQTSTGAGLFGSSASAFGQNKPAFGGFGSSTGSGLFGAQPQQQQPQQQQVSLFGQNKNIFGTSGFVGTAGSAPVGTTVKFNPLVASDTMVKNGVSHTISTRHQCITCMKDYEGKSLEELRMEDYLAGRKGPQQQTTGGLFSNPAQQQPLFGAAPMASSSGNTLFGQTEAKPAFGTTSSGGFGSSGGLFSQSNPFGKPGGFGTTTTTTATGGFGSAPTAGGLFGTQNKPFGVASPQMSGSGLFASPTTQGTTGFGTQSSGFGGFGAPPNQTIGLFQQPNKPTFGLTNTTASGLNFGQNVATSSGTGGLFGPKPATPSFGSSVFGTGGTTSFGTGFGTTQAQNPFGQQFKTGTSGFGTGQSTLGQTGLGTGLGTSGTSFLGAAASRPGGLFGTGTSSFGMGTNMGFGSGLGVSMGVMGGSMLGGGTLGTPATSQPTGPSQSQLQMMALTAMPFGDSPLFRNLIPATGKAEELLKPTNPAAQKAILANSQYKVSPQSKPKVRVKPVRASHLTKSVFDGLEEEDSNKKEPQKIIKKNGTGWKDLVWKPRSTESPSTGANELGRDGQRNLEQGRYSVGSRSSVQSPVDTREGNTHVSNFMASELQTVDRATLGLGRISPLLKRHAPRDTASSEKSTAESTMLELNPRLNTSNEGENKENQMYNNASQISDDSVHADTDSEVVTTLEDCPPHPCGIVLRRSGYYTLPPSDELVTFVNEEGCCVIEGFTIGREGYGNIYFPGTVDLTNMNLDEIVHFRHKEVVVYPDDENKPPVGEGLNQRAQVTLDRVWPTDKTTHLPITSPERLVALGFEAKLRRACAKMGARFLDYQPDTGSWVFRVDHFSKYGLSDSDEEDLAVVDAAKKVPVAAPPKVPPSAAQAIKPLQPVKPDGQQMMDLAEQRPVRGLGGESVLERDEEMADGSRAPETEQEEDLMDDLDVSPRMLSTDVGMDAGSSSRHVQLMKASFFSDDEMEDDLEIHPDADYELVSPRKTMRRSAAPQSRVKAVPSPEFPREIEEEEEDDDKENKEAGDNERPNKLARSMNLFRMQFAKPEPKTGPAVTVPSMKIVEPHALPRQFHIPSVPPSAGIIYGPVVRPKAVTVQHAREVQPLSKSLFADRSAFVCDAALFKSRGCRPAWAPGAVLVHLQSDCSQSFGEKGGLLSLTRHSRINMLPSSLSLEPLWKTTEENIKAVEPHLSIQLRCSERRQEGGVPLFCPVPGVESLHRHAEAKDCIGVTSLSQEVWHLCKALWGKLSDMPDDAVEDASHEWILSRRDALSEWLRKVTERDIEDGVVFSLVTSGRLLEACDTAQKKGDHYAAALLAQAGGPPSVRRRIHLQLESWEEVGADRLVEVSKLKEFSIAAGLPLYRGSDNIVNVCEGLDWLRAFALHFWYVCSSIASIGDVVNEYEKAFRGTTSQAAYAAYPLPFYVGGLVEDAAKEMDVCYHLLKLYSSRAHSLKDLLNPASHVEDPLDFRLSWLLMQVLLSLGYTHVDAYEAAHIHTSFATQLEAAGLWTWAVFVLLHLKGPRERECAVRELLGRHVKLTTETDYLEKEQFLQADLGIPSEWIYSAKATLASVSGLHREEAWYLLRAGQWNKAHDVIMRHIASDAVVNENYDVLKQFLGELTTDNRSAAITGWASGGSLIWDYVCTVDEAKQLDKRSDIMGWLERLRPKLTSLCTRISSLPCYSAKDRLCQCEIAKRTIQYVRLVQELQQQRGITPVLANLVTRLPLPEDCALQELLELSHSYLEEVTL